MLRPTEAEMSGDVLAMKKKCSGGDGPARKLTRDVLTKLR